MSNVQVSVTMSRAGIDRLLHSVDGPVGSKFVQFCNRVANTAKTKANVDTGLMRSTIRADVRGTPDGLEGTVGAYTEYAIYVHELHNPFLTDALHDELGRGL